MGMILQNSPIISIVIRLGQANHPEKVPTYENAVIFYQDKSCMLGRRPKTLYVKYVSE